jgi:hypothetical protein
MTRLSLQKGGDVEDESFFTDNSPHSKFYNVIFVIFVVPTLNDNRPAPRLKRYAGLNL